jgi:chromosome condensin MukBEF complex kleisin-like MukF subunit
MTTTEALKVFDPIRLAFKTLDQNQGQVQEALNVLITTEAGRMTADGQRALDRFWSAMRDLADVFRTIDRRARSRT